MAEDAVVRIILQDSGNLSTQGKTASDSSTSTNQPTIIGTNTPAALERKQTAEIVQSIKELTEITKRLSRGEDKQIPTWTSSFIDSIKKGIGEYTAGTFGFMIRAMGGNTEPNKQHIPGQLDHLKAIADNTKDTKISSSLISKSNDDILKLFGEDHKQSVKRTQLTESIEKLTTSSLNTSKMIMEKLYSDNVFTKDTGAEGLTTIQEEARLGMDRVAGQKYTGTSSDIAKLTGAGKGQRTYGDGGVVNEGAEFQKDIASVLTSELPIEFGQIIEGVSSEELEKQMKPKIKGGEKGVVYTGGNRETLSERLQRIGEGAREGLSDMNPITPLKQAWHQEASGSATDPYKKAKVKPLGKGYAQPIPPEQLAQLYAQAAAAQEEQGFYPKPKPELAGLPEDFAAPFAPTVELWEEPPQEQLPTPPKPDTQLRSAKKTDLGIPDPEDVQLKPPPTKFESTVAPEPEDREEDYILSLGEQTKSVLPSKLELQDDSAERLAKAWEEFDANPPHHGTGWHLPRTEDNPGGYTEEHLAELGEVGLGPHGSMITKAIYEEMVMERRRRGNLNPPTFAQGGWVGNHPGEPKGKDTIPAWLSEGEFVVNPDAAAKNRGTLEEINSGQTRYMAEGGSVTKAEKASLWEFGRIGEMLVAPIKNMAMGTLGGAKWAAGANSDPAQSISSFGGAITSAGQALGKFLPVVGGVTEAAGMVVQSFAALMQEIDKTVDRYGQYSPEIQQAKAIAEIRQTLGDMARAQEAGAELAEYVLTKSDMEQKFEEAKIKILIQIVPLVTQVLEAIIAVVPTGDGIEKAIINLSGPLWALTEWMGQGVTNQKDAMLKELEDPTDMILKNKNFSEDNGQRGDWVPNL